MVDIRDKTRWNGADIYDHAAHSTVKHDRHTCASRGHYNSRSLANMRVRLVARTVVRAIREIE